MNHQFSRVPNIDIPRSRFDRSHGVKTTFDSGYLVPIYIDEVIPGDTFNMRGNGFARMATPLFPVMDNIFMETFFFYVPHRLVWDNFKRMMGEQDDPADSIDFQIPTLDFTGTYQFEVGTVFDYLGLPTDINLTDADNISALPLRAHNLIYNTWFRDQNLQDSVTVLTTDGPDPVANYSLYRRGKRHDYFTSCLPWPQKGPDVFLPLGSTAPITGLGNITANTQWPVSGIGKLNREYPDTGTYYTAPSGSTSFTYAAQIDPGAVVTDNDYIIALRGTAATNGNLDIYASNSSATSVNPGTFVADLSQATAGTLSEFREAIQTQRLYEQFARGGTRYIEMLKSIWGVTSSDRSLQRPEYLGGGSTRINVNPVASTTSAPGIDPGSTRPIGDLGAMVVGSFQGHGFSKSFEEHGTVIGYVNIRCDLNYQQGLDRMWSRRDRLDQYFPAYAQLGEQAVLNKEIYFQGAAAGTEDDDVFGYQERYAEFRYKPSRICGEFRSTFAQSLDAWHLAQDFSSLPVLGDTFIQDNSPFDRVLAVQDGSPQFIADFYFDLNCARPMPLYGVPASLGRF